MARTHSILLAALLLAGCGSSPEDEPTAAGPPTVDACGAKLLEVPEDFTERGPSPVGVRTAKLGGRTVEIWYPAQLGSDAGEDAETYDIRKLLPDSEMGKIPDDDAPFQKCDCHRDLPLDTERGPYPVLVFIHGTAAFRSQSLTQATHWASRGFVVVAQDHPGLYLRDFLDLNLGGRDLEGDTQELLDMLDAPKSDFEFLAGHIAPEQLGMAGHSAGGAGVSGWGDRAKVLIPMAAGGTSKGKALESTLVLGAVNDAVVDFSAQTGGYEMAPKPKRLFGLKNAGHLAFSDLCALLNDEGQDFIEIGIEHQIKLAEAAGSTLWDGCEDSDLAPGRAARVVNTLTTAAFEETLRCDARATKALADAPARFDELTNVESEL